MQHPVGYKVSGGEAELTDVGALLTNNFALRAFLHTLLAGLTTGSLVVFGVACWHLLRGRNIELFRKAAMLALIVAVPVTLLQHDGRQPLRRSSPPPQPMKIAAAEALWDTAQPASLLALPDRRLHHAGPRPERPIIESRSCSRSSRHRLVQRQGRRPESAPGAVQRQYGRGNYIPSVATAYWAHAGHGVPRRADVPGRAVGAYLYRQGKLESTRWFLWTAVVAMAFPFLAATAGWVLTEMGRQPWIVQGLLKTGGRTPRASAAPRSW